MGKLEESQVRGSRPQASLYVHVPFCAAKCNYCDFYSFAANPDDALGFVDLLLLEAQARAPLEPTTVFIGGGTPSWLSPPDITRLVDGLDQITSARKSATEITVECNPESLTRKKAELFRELGVTRLSIGVQSLRPQILKTFGRVHAPRDAFLAFEAAVAAGFQDINLDLIYASPGQRLDEWEEDLRRVIDWGPSHVSAYLLAFETGTAFERWRKEGRLSSLPEEAELEFFMRTRELLEDEGLMPYEISNFSREGRSCSHNINYWLNGSYVGLGPSAVSRIGDTRRGNAPSLERWRSSIAATGSAVVWEETLTPLKRLAETWWLGLRMSRGVMPAEARSSSGFAHPTDPFVGVAETLLSEGFLEFRDGRFALSPKGLPLADAVAKRFFDVVPATSPDQLDPD